MDRFLIESPHEEGDCRNVVKNVYYLGYLYNCDWGCKAGVHKAWVMIEAENDKQALLLIPPILRNKATATKIVKFGPEMIEEWKKDET